MPSDKIDNDCDGTTDEEMVDGKDNDGDGLIDEDFIQVVNSIFGEGGGYYLSMRLSQYSH